MKYIIFFIVIITGLLIISCGEEHTYTEVYQYLTLINCDGTGKIQLSEDNPGKMVFYNNDQKLLYSLSNKFISLDLNSFNFETVYTNMENWHFVDFETFTDMSNLIFWDSSNERDLHLLTLENEIVENLTNTIEKKEDSVKLSPSEEYFAYIEKDYTIEDSVKWSIKYRNYDGSVENTVISKPQGYGPGEFRHIDWISNDKLIYSDNDAGINPGIYSINLDGSENQFIYEGLYIDFSICEDRTKVVFESDDEIYLIDTADFSVEHLTSGKEPVISPDGNKLAYQDEVSDLVVWDLTEDTIALISETPYFPAWFFSDDSQKLVFNEQVIITYNRDKRIM